MGIYTQEGFGSSTTLDPNPGSGAGEGDSGPALISTIHFLFQRNQPQRPEKEDKEKVNKENWIEMSLWEKVELFWRKNILFLLHFQGYSESDLRVANMSQSKGDVGKAVYLLTKYVRPPPKPYNITLLLGYTFSHSHN